MSFWYNFVGLCNELGKSANAVASEIGISSGAVTKWKEGSVPRSSTLLQIADYFSVPVEFLTEEKEKPLVNNDERLTALLERARDEDRMLFSLATTARVEDVQLAIEMLRRLREGERQ